MNPVILHAEVQQFISENLQSNITKLILKGSPFKEVTIQEIANQIVAKQKAAEKLPTWFGCKNVYFPEKISVEQTSSEITADYKSKIVSGKKMIDITGGLGVDSFYFSKQFEEVTYCEINQELSTIVKHNYQQFNIDNVTFFSGDGLTFLKNDNQFFDCIYIDPSRRNDAKEKVFLLKECLPNVPENINFLFSKTSQIVLKNSPILDITNAVKELKYVKEIHVVAVKNEVKEVLFLLEKDYQEPIIIKTINSLKNRNELFNFTYQEQVEATYSEPQNYLYEPNAAILKAGAFQQVSQQFNIAKLHQHSHLYTSDKRIDFPGRIFNIEQIIVYDKKKIGKLLNENKANITTRNFPKTVAQIRKETKIKEGGNSFLFFTTNLYNKLVVIFCTKI